MAHHISPLAPGLGRGRVQDCKACYLVWPQDSFPRGDPRQTGKMPPPRNHVRSTEAGEEGRAETGQPPWPDQDSGDEVAGLGAVLAGTDRTLITNPDPSWTEF